MNPVSIFSTTLSCERTIGILGCTLRSTNNLSEHTVPKKRGIFSRDGALYIFGGLLKDKLHQEHYRIWDKVVIK